MNTELARVGVEGSMLSQTSEYVLKAAVCLAATRGRLVTVRELSALTGVPQNYLSKVLLLMAGKGIVAGRRGVGGGYTLELDPESATVLTVVRLLGYMGEQRPGHGERRDTQMSFAPLKRVLDEGYNAVISIYGRSTLAMLAREGAGPGGGVAPDVVHTGGLSRTEN